MNRIYQGRVSKVQVLKPGAKGDATEDWQDLENWPAALWQHHELFQIAVNYYTLCLAAMARGMDEPAFEAVAIVLAKDAAARDPKHRTDSAREKAGAAAGGGVAPTTGRSGW